MISLIVYPIEAHWIWGGGWLLQIGFHDYAGHESFCSACFSGEYPTAVPETVLKDRFEMKIVP